MTGETGLKIEGLDLILLILAVLVFLKLFVLTGCPCGCGSASSLWCKHTSNQPESFGDAMQSEAAMVSLPDPEDKPTIYYHYTAWCGYCKKMKPLWDEVKAEMSNDAFFLANDEDQTQTPGVNSYPTIIAHMNGEKIKYDGGYNKKELLAFVRNAVDMKKGLKKRGFAS